MTKRKQLPQFIEAVSGIGKESNEPYCVVTLAYPPKSTKTRTVVGCKAKKFFLESDEDHIAEFMASITDMPFAANVKPTFDIDDEGNSRLSALTSA